MGHVCPAGHERVNSTCYVFQYRGSIIEQCLQEKSYTSKGTTLILCHAQILYNKNSILKIITKNLSFQENITNGGKPLVFLPETQSVIHKSKIDINYKPGVCM